MNFHKNPVFTVLISPKCYSFYEQLFSVNIELRQKTRDNVHNCFWKEREKNSPQNTVVTFFLSRLYQTTLHPSSLKSSGAFCCCSQLNQLMFGLVWLRDAIKIDFPFYLELDRNRVGGSLGGQPLQNFFWKKIIPESEVEGSGG